MAEASLLPLCTTGEISAGAPLRVEVDGFAYAVFQLGTQYHVLADQCTHGPGFLGEGAVIGDEVECPFHQGRFHIPTGMPRLPPCSEPVRAFAVRVIDGRICIDSGESR